MEYREKLFDFISASPTAYHAVISAGKELEKAGFIHLSEGDKWALQPGKGYYTSRGGSSLIAFRTPDEAGDISFSITAAHIDSPTFKLKENPEIHAGGYVTLNTERYGGMIMSTWLDRPLSVAGRITVKHGNEYTIKPVNIDKDLLVIPNLAIHMDRGVNDGKKFDPQKDTLPLMSMEGDEADIVAMAAQTVGEEKENVVGHDLYLYARQRGVCTGSRGQFLLSPRLDDIMCAFSGLMGIINCEKCAGVPVLALFDNEEVGSISKQGAGSTFLHDVLGRIGRGLAGDDFNLTAALYSSFMLSADNAHAAHPNALHLADPVNRPVMNGGVVIKYAASGRYVTDGVSAGILKGLMGDIGLKYQVFANRSDMPGGATLGNIANSQVPINSVDLGIAQLAMHSAVETAGRKDLGDLVALCTKFFSTKFSAQKDKIILG